MAHNVGDDMMMAAVPEVLCEKRGVAGVITLNRPKVLNALTPGMVALMLDALNVWKDDPEIALVLVKGAGDKAFCAGGDIRWVREVCLDGRRDEALAFWHEEYRLNTLIKYYPKPYISLIDGIVMGGGVGVSVHGSHRIAGDRYMFAMPEVAIGFFPDVGAAYVLSQLPGLFGLYLALTGDRIRRADAIYLGLATHAVASGGFEQLEQRLVAGESLDVVLEDLAASVEVSNLEREKELIDRCFSADSVKEIISRLEQTAESDFSAHLLSAFAGKSPTSLCIAHEQMHRSASLSFDEVMKMDYRLSTHLSEEGSDFYEGVRAVLVDKNGKPTWDPAHLDDISTTKIHSYFASLGPKELKIS